MKITYSEEFVVCQGPTHEEYEWGAVQFPTIHKDNDGNLLIRVHWADDSWDCFGKDNVAWFKSTNGGKNWDRISNKQADNTVGTVLPNGDKIYFPEVPALVLRGEEAEKTIKPPRRWGALLPTDTIKKEEDGTFPYPYYTFCDNVGEARYIYEAATLPDEYSKNEWLMRRIKKGETVAQDEIVPVDHPNRSTNMGYFLHNGTFYSMLSFSPLCKTKVDPDGNIWVASYTGSHLNPYTKGPDTRSASVLYKSTDGGKSFKLQSYIPFIPDTTKRPTSCFGGGFNEIDFEFMDDGSIIVLLRTADVYSGEREWNDMFYARSTDGGKTFSEPKEFDIGVLPKLCKLDCGVTLAAYGRPGIFIRPVDNATGTNWGERIEIMTPNDRSHLSNAKPERATFHQWCGSCCNVDIMALDENHALLTYSDFYYPDQSGKTDKKLKTILARIITVE